MAVFREMAIGTKQIPCNTVTPHRRGDDTDFINADSAMLIECPERFGDDRRSVSHHGGKYVALFDPRLSSTACHMTSHFFNLNADILHSVKMFCKSKDQGA